MGARLDGRRILVTGAAQGLGAVLARACAAEGARVAIADVQDTPGQAVATELDATFHHLDIRDPDGWARTIDEVTAAHGGLDGLVNNAAILHMGSIETTSADTVRRVLEVNVLGTYLGIQAAIAPMRAAGGGSIVNIGSIDAHGGMNAIAAYS